MHGLLRARGAILQLDFFRDEVVLASNGFVQLVLWMR